MNKPEPSIAEEEIQHLTERFIFTEKAVRRVYIYCNNNYKKSGTILNAAMHHGLDPNDLITKFEAAIEAKKIKAESQNKAK